MYAIECRGLTKVYKKAGRRFKAVDGLTLSIEAGQVYGFLGANGAGKTTTIRMMLDLVRPTGGDVMLFGEAVRRNPKALKQVGALVEGASFYPYLSGWENLRIFGWTLGKFDPKRADDVLNQVELAKHQHAKVSQYSTGMKQRLGIAAALLHDPPLIILDEPTNGLDPMGIRDMRAFIRKLADDDGKTVFISSHLLSEIQQICDRVAIISQGKLIAEDTVQALLQRKQESTNQLTLEVTPTEQAATLLSQNWQVSAGEQANTIIVDAPHEAIPNIARELINAGINLYGIQHKQVTLEDFFFAITEEEQPSEFDLLSDKEHA